MQAKRKSTKSLKAGVSGVKISKLLKISDGDILVLRGRITFEEAKRLHDLLHNHFKKDVVLLSLQEDQTVESIDRKKLAASGWVFAKLDDLSEAIHSLWRDVLSTPPGQEYNQGYNQALEDAAGMLAGNGDRHD